VPLAAALAAFANRTAVSAIKVTRVEVPRWAGTDERAALTHLTEA
jgi:hypothetical protein